MNLARALSGNLTARQEECALDALTALALGSVGPGRQSHLNSLGVSLIAFKRAQLPAYHARAMMGLADALAWRKVRNRVAVAKQAILEWTLESCETCTGTREVFNLDGVSIACFTCSGSGKRKWSDEERCGIPGKSMSEAHRLLTLAISIATRGAIERLK